MKTTTLFLIYCILALASFGQTKDINFSRKFCFSNFNGQLYLDTNTNSIYSQIYLASSTKIKINKIATPKQKKIILSTSENSTVGTYYSKIKRTNSYLLTSTFKPSGDNFKLTARQIENSKEPYLKSNSNISTSFIVDDTSEFLDMRKICDTTLLKFVPDNHVIIQTIYKDINGDFKAEILLASMTVYYGPQSTEAEADGPEEYLIQLLRKNGKVYETIFSYTSPPAILKYVDLIKLKGQTNYSIILYGENCWRDCHPKFEIITIGEGNLDNCVKEFSY